MTFQPDKYQEKCMPTWYDKDNPLYLDARHPLIALAGEAGELLNLLKKHEYKLGFDWFDCKCKWDKNSHKKGLCPSQKGIYTPLVLDEAGDWWYYARIITWQQGEKIKVKKVSNTIHSKLECLSKINILSAEILDTWQETNFVSIEKLQLAIDWFQIFLAELDTDLDKLTELNYAKLNSEPTAHGWKA